MALVILFGVVGISQEGVDFESLDGEKCHLFILLLYPPDRPGDHLRALENISRLLRDDSYVRLLTTSIPTRMNLVFDSSVSAAHREFFIRELIDEKTVTVPHVEVDNNQLLFTATPEQWTELLKEHGTNSSAFESVIVLEKTAPIETAIAEPE